MGEPRLFTITESEGCGFKLSSLTAVGRTALG